MKFSNHWFRKYQAMGRDMKKASAISFKKSLERRLVTVAMDAPNTLRTPISLRRCSTISDTMAKSPRQDRMIATVAAEKNMEESLCSFSYQRRVFSVR